MHLGREEAFPMKTLIVYESVHHGNTERVARAIAEVLGAKLARPHEVSAADLLAYDLVGFGSGIYFGRHHRRLRRFVRRLPWTSKPAFVFSTSGAPRKQHRALELLLWRRGFTLDGSFTCPGFDTVGPLRFIGGLNKGRPSAQDLEAARAFARDLLTRLEPVTAAA
jgi:flavodoxin